MAIFTIEASEKEEFEKWKATHDSKIRVDAIEEFVERVEKTDINSSNYPMNQVNLVKMQMLKEQQA